MRHIIHKASLVVLFLFIFFPVLVKAQGKVVSIDMNAGQAEITLVEGGVFLVREDLTRIRPLIQGEFLSAGNRITTGKSSRIEIKLPDQSFIRLDELATFVLVSVGVDENTNSRNINVKMTLGKIWANVSKLFANKGRFSLSTQTAIAGVRGTIYRMNVDEDKSVLVKVYQGEVGVSSAANRNAAGQTAPANEPPKIVKPHPVPGPHPVSLAEWTHIVKSLQQIIVRPDGTITEPFRFSLEEDSNDWVRWNQMRDETLGIQQR